MSDTDNGAAALEASCTAWINVVSKSVSELRTAADPPDMSVKESLDRRDAIIAELRSKGWQVEGF